MKRLVLLVLFAFGMNVNAQDYAVVDNKIATNEADDLNREYSNRASLSESNRANFIKKYSKEAKSISKSLVNGKIVALKKGYTYKQKFHWLIMVINDSKKVDLFAFSSNTDFSMVKYTKVNKNINFKSYILDNY